DLARDEVALAEGADELREPAALDRDELEDEQGGNGPRVGGPEILEVVVARDLAGESGAVLAHGDLHEGMAHPAHVRGAAQLGDGVSDRTAGADVVEDRRTGLLAEDLLGEQS